MKLKSLIVVLFLLFCSLNHDKSYGEQKSNSLASKISEGMVLIKGGCFEMGDTIGEGNKYEKLVHEVCLNDFYLGEHEVTQGEWKEIMGNNPSFFKNCGDDCPVEQVSWMDVQEYIKILNEKAGADYRLPTEAEWEYAARIGGKNRRFGTGKDIIGPDEANFNGSAIYKKVYSRAGQFREKTVPVKTFKPNALGIYDMAGNVFDWLADWFVVNYYQDSPRDNPQGPASGLGPPVGLFRVIRGGSYLSSPIELRASARNHRRPQYKHAVLGFRLARTP